MTDSIRLVLREGQVTNYELTARAADARQTEVSYNAVTFYDETGKAAGRIRGRPAILPNKRHSKSSHGKTALTIGASSNPR